MTSSPLLLTIFAALGTLLLLPTTVWLPVIVTDVNGSDEAICSGVNGVIVPKYSSEALYRAMSDMVSDRDATANMAAVARKMVASRFDQKDVWAALANMYKEL